MIDATDPRLRLLEGVRERSCPAVTHARLRRSGGRRATALHRHHPDNWSASPVLRASSCARPWMWRRRSATATTCRTSLASPAGSAQTGCCVIAATRSEQTVLRHRLDGDIVRHDVEQKTVSFRHFRLFGFAATEEALRQRIADIVLEGLADRRAGREINPGSGRATGWPSPSASAAASR